MKMRSRGSFLLHIGLLTVAGFFATHARAETLVQKNVMVSLPTTPQIESLNITSPGTLTVTLGDLGWPKMLSSLSFAVTNATSVLAQMTGVGSLVYDVTSPGAFFAAVYAQPDASVGTGLYHINVDFSPAAPPPPPVPLPASVWMLLSGVCGFAALRGKHATVTNSIV
jgi:hypothetical protein